MRKIWRCIKTEVLDTKCLCHDVYDEEWSLVNLDHTLNQLPKENAED